MSSNAEAAELKKVRHELKRLANEQERTADYLKAIAQMKKVEMGEPVTTRNIEIDD